MVRLLSLLKQRYTNLQALFEPILPYPENLEPIGLGVQLHRDEDAQKGAKGGTGRAADFLRLGKIPKGCPPVPLHS